MVEDSEADARLVLRELQQGGYEPKERRVETAAGLTEALTDQEWDVVICDFRLPSFNALAALELVRASGLDLPFILVSGTVGEEQAVAMMKAGAHDFLLKDRLARLAPAVGRELGDAEARKQRRQAVEESSRTNEKLQGILNSITDGLAVLDRNWCFTYFSEQAAKILGMRPEQLLGGCFWELFPHTKDTRHYDEYHRAVETGQPAHFEDYYPEPFNLWLECHCYPSDEGLSVYFRDITQRRKVEDALLASEKAERARRQELEALMDAIPVAILISRDADNCRVTANRTAEELLRLPHGKNPSQSAPDGERPDFQVWSDGHRVAPEELPMQRATATGQAVSAAEIEIVFPDGERKSLLSSAYPLFDESGVVRGCICAEVDITVRKRRELNVAFLAETQKSLSSIPSPREIMRLTGARIAEFLDLDHCLFVEINEAAGEATVIRDHHVGDGPSLEGVYRLKDFHTEHELREMAAGRMIVIDDVSHHPRPAPSSEQFKALGIGSLANASHVADGRWKFVLSAIRNKPSQWPPEDTDLLAELVERIHMRLERARAEERLADNETRFRSIFHDAAVPMEVSLPDGRFMQVNRAFCELLGFAEEELLEMTFDSITYPEDRESLGREPLQDLIEGATSGYRAEKRYIRKDGRVVWVDVSVSVVRDADDKPLYFIGQVQDITGRKQAEASLRKSENMLALAIEAGQLGIWNWDQFTRTLVWSDRCNEMTGLPRGIEISVKEAIGTIHPDERHQIEMEAKRALKSGSDIELEYRTLWPDGSVHWLQTRGRAIYDASTKLVRITGIIQDVTARRESEEALRRFNTQLESLVDARTEVIKMTMKELQREFAERRRLEEEILDIGERAQARIGQDLHDDLGQQLVGMTILMGLLSSHLGAESHPRAAEAARLQTFLTGIINTTRNLAKSLYPVELERGGLNLSLQELASRTEMLTGITCRLNADAGFKFDKAVEIHLYRIVQESISNSLKHGKAKNISIDCTVQDGFSTLTVTDDGTGFVRPEEGKWAGIGLHLFQYRARLIGAQLTVTRGENGGCQVRCSIGGSDTPGKQSLQT